LKNWPFEVVYRELLSSDEPKEEGWDDIYVKKIVPKTLELEQIIIGHLNLDSQQRDKNFFKLSFSFS
jgi:hypothetical protein